MNLHRSIKSSVILISAAVLPILAQNSRNIKVQILHELQSMALQSVNNQQKQVLHKSALAMTEILVVDSVESWTWNNSSWSKDACTKYSYDDKGRTSEVIKNEKYIQEPGRTIYKYESDGVTVRQLQVGGMYKMIYGTDTVVTINKYFPGYSNVLSLTDEWGSSQVLSGDLAEFQGIDSTATLMYYRDTNGVVDTTQKVFSRYSKSGSKLVTAEITIYSKGLTSSLSNYSVSYHYAGNALMDTVVCRMNLDKMDDSQYKDFLKDMQYAIMVTKKNLSGQPVEQTMIASKDSTFPKTQQSIKMSLSYNSSQLLESEITQEWDTLQQAWQNSAKMNGVYKKILVGIRKSNNSAHEINAIQCKSIHNGFLFEIPASIKVNSIEQFDMQGKLLYRNVVTDQHKNQLQWNITNGRNAVSLIHFKTSNGTYTYGVSAIK